MATSVLGLKTFAASDPVDVNEVNDNYVKIDNGVKTAMQGRAAHNILDNSYFKKKREIVNQRGKTSYSGSGYTIDRWYLYDPSGDGSLVINDGYISLTGGTGSVSLSCRFPKGIIDANKTYTTVVCDNQGNINPCSLFFYDSFDSFEFSAGAGETKNIFWAALYEGAYTADTLPAYQPKGYAAELAECQMYYRIGVQAVTIGKLYAGGSIFSIDFPKMRIYPTIKLLGISSQGWGNVDENNYTQGWSDDYGSEHYVNFTSSITDDVGKTVVVKYENCADL